MTIRRPRSVCLFCQSRQALVGRRRVTNTARQRVEVETRAITPEEDGFVLGNARKDAKADPDNDSRVLPLEASARQWSLSSPIDELREALLGFDALWKRRDLRINVLRTLSNPWPETPVHERLPPKIKTTTVLPEASAALIPHAIFRQRLAAAIYDKDIRKILRVQLLRCEWPREILRVMAVAMQDTVTAQSIATMVEPIMRALYRSRNNVSDPDVLRTLNTIIARFTIAKLPVDPILPQLGVKFAARCRSLPAMKKYLKMIRENNIEMTSNLFRSVIAKFSIGHRGLGEIRNGRWRRDQLLQVVNGFEDAKDLPPEQQYHLGSWLNREEWQYLHGWVAVLSRCKDSDGVWHEWKLWKQNAARVHPRKLGGQDSKMTSKRRGDYWFVEQMTFSGDLKRAWQMLAETGLSFASLHERVRMRLLDGVEFATIWNENVRNEMIRKYDKDLSHIEEALGVKWVPGPSGEDGDGTHETVRDQEESLEKLATDELRLEQSYGFPHESGQEVLVPCEDRALHDAEEREPASDDRS